MSTSDELRLYVFAPVWGMPSASPFCVKLDAWLRMAGIPFETHVVKGKPESETGKAPYIRRPDGTLLSDSQRIIEFLGKEHGIALDDALDDEQRATSHLLRRTLEGSLYFAILWQRWGVDEHWPVVRENYFAEMPTLLRKTVPTFIRKSVQKQLHGHGMGRRRPAAIYAEAESDIAAIATALGDDDFFFGEPTNVDASAYGMLGSIMAAPIEDRLKQAVEDHPTLIEYCRRMEARYY